MKRTGVFMGNATTPMATDTTTKVSLALVSVVSMLLLTYWSNNPSSTLFCLFTVEVTVRGKVGSPISIINNFTASTWFSSDEGGWMLCLHRVKHDDETETLSVLNSSVLLVWCIPASLIGACRDLWTCSHSLSVSWLCWSMCLLVDWPSYRHGDEPDRPEELYRSKITPAVQHAKI